MKWNDGAWRTVIEDDGGEYIITAKVMDDGTETALIRFGASFTLRLNENNIDELRDILYEVSRELASRRARMEEDSE